MTKPQTGAEPSMEDILASIRKMISEERLGPRPIPDQIGRTSYPARADKLEAQQPISPAPERGTPSFSSLSDALKAAAPAADRSLDEKIADMLGKGTATAAPTDSLAVFSANRPTPAPTIHPQPRTPDPTARTPTARPDPTMPGGAQRSPAPGAGSPLQPTARSRGGPNGAPGAKQAGASTVVPLTGETPAGGGESGQPRPAAVAKSSDSERIVAMPSRHPSVSGAGHAGASSTGPATNGSALNGATVSPLGARAASPSRPATVMRDANRVSDKLADEVLGKVAEKLLPKGPATPSGNATVKADATRPASSPFETPSAKAPGAMPGPAAKGSAPMTGKAGNALDSAEEATPKVSHTPSEALLDAVVDLVHKEPDTLSVFTSGSAFIHGVTGDGGLTSAGEQASGGPPRQLDRSAAELLRPMLRQWLADNMPRIVEEALRSELMSSQPSPGEPKDTGKG